MLVSDLHCTTIMYVVLCLIKDIQARHTVIIDVYQLCLLSQVCYLIVTVTHLFNNISLYH